MRPVCSALRLLLLVNLLLCAAAGIAQATSNSYAPPVEFTAEQAHQHMMELLGIRALRPGPSGDPKASNHANYDEAKANPFPNLPDALRLNDGREVTTAKQWWVERRPQIVADFEQYVYGRVPKDLPRRVGPWLPPTRR